MHRTASEMLNEKEGENSWQKRGELKSSGLGVAVGWGSPGALCTEGTVAAELKLKLVQARGPWGSAHRGRLAGQLRAEAGAGWGIPGHFVPGVHWQIVWS